MSVTNAIEGGESQKDLGAGDTVQLAAAAAGNADLRSVLWAIYIGTTVRLVQRSEIWYYIYTH